MTERQKKKVERNEQICSQFNTMGGTITSRIENISTALNLAEITVRVILTKNGLIGNHKNVTE